MKQWSGIVMYLYMGMITCSFSEYNYTEEGKASYYSDYFEGRQTASGALFSQTSLTAAHQTLPFGTEVLVRAENGKEITVIINDRGPFIKGRIIDLSKAAADSLDLVRQGVGQVKIWAKVEE